jgi:small subunit ribosomal protein S13
MLYFFNKKLNIELKIQYALVSIYGLNVKTIKKICKTVGLNPSSKIKNLDNFELIYLQNFIIKNFIIEDNLILNKNRIIEKQKIIKSYKGVRKIFNLPSRGQRTHSNAKTLKGGLKFKHV